MPSRPTTSTDSRLLARDLRTPPSGRGARASVTAIVRRAHLAYLAARVELGLACTFGTYPSTPIRGAMATIAAVAGHARRAGFALNLVAVSACELRTNPLIRRADALVAPITLCESRPQFAARAELRRARELRTYPTAHLCIAMALIATIAGDARFPRLTLHNV